MSGAHSKHEFALYVPNLTALLSRISVAQVLVLDDTEIVHRIQSVLRLEPGEEIRLFNRHTQALCIVQSVHKKEVRCLISESKETIPLAPSVTFFLPLLKKEDLEAALYSLVELGASAVQLVVTEKSRQLGPKEREQKELERLERVMIAAAEQSKQFSISVLSPAISFEALLGNLAQKKPGSVSIFFDPAGDDLFTVMSDLRKQNPAEIFLLVGPEGDLTEAEKGGLAKTGIRFCKLTPTVLRALQATAVGIGVVRSVVSPEKAH